MPSGWKTKNQGNLTLYTIRFRGMVKNSIHAIQRYAKFFPQWLSAIEL